MKDHADIVHEKGKKEEFDVEDGRGES